MTSRSELSTQTPLSFLLFLFLSFFPLSYQHHFAQLHFVPSLEANEINTAGRADAASVASIPRRRIFACRAMLVQQLANKLAVEIINAHGGKSGCLIFIFLDKKGSPRFYKNVASLAVPQLKEERLNANQSRLLALSN